MGQPDDRLGKLGAVAAILVATAPDAGPQAADLLWRMVAGRPLISWPLQALTQLDQMSSCFIQVMLDHRANGRDLVSGWPPGGAVLACAAPRGPRSWLRILENGRTHTDWLIVVDATLPLVTTASLRAGLRAAAQTGVAMAGEPVKETLKRVQGQQVAETPPRDTLRRLLTPIIFSREAIWRLLDSCDLATTDANDLLALTRLTGTPLTVFDAGYPAARVTADDDLTIVEALLSQRESEAH